MVFTIFSLVSLNSFRTHSLCFCASFPSNLKKPMPLLFKGISRRSKNEVHWLKTMLFSPQPDPRIRSKQSKSFETFEDSFQLVSTSTQNWFSVGHVMRSVFFSNCRQIGHNPVVGVRQLERRHSLHILCAHGVRTGSSAYSMHMGHSVFSPFRIPSTTSSMYAWVGPVWFVVEESGLISRNLLASLLRSAYFWEPARLHIFQTKNYFETKTWKECGKMKLMTLLARGISNIFHTS